MCNSVFFLLAVFLEGIFSLVLLLNIPTNPKNAWLFGYSSARIALTTILGIPILMILYLLASTLQKGRAAQKTGDLVRRWMNSDRRALVTFSVGIFGVGLGMG